MKRHHFLKVGSKMRILLISENEFFMKRDGMTSSRDITLVTSHLIQSFKLKSTLDKLMKSTILSIHSMLKTIHNIDANTHSYID